MQHFVLSTWLFDHIKGIPFVSKSQFSSELIHHSSFNGERENGYNLLVEIIKSNNDENATDYIVEQKFLFDNPVNLRTIAQKVEELQYQSSFLEIDPDVLVVSPLQIVETD